MVISPQLRRSQREPEDQKPLPFEMLRDEGNRVADKYNLAFKVTGEVQQVYLKMGLDLDKINGDWSLPMPARFVIDRTGTIRAMDVDPDYSRRPEPAQTLEVLRTLRR